MFDECDPRLKGQTYGARENVKLPMPDIFLQVSKLAVDELLGVYDPADLDRKPVDQAFRFFQTTKCRWCLFIRNTQNAKKPR
jgi:hypothetical protein